MPSETSPPPYGRRESLDKVKDILLAINQPFIVEVGTTRIKDNWEGDGYSTPLFAWIAQQRDGRLVSIDISPEHIAVGRSILEQYDLNTGQVNLVCADAIELGSRWANQYGAPIDLLYLDGWDWEGSEELKRFSETQHLEFFKLMEPFLRDKSYVLIDDITDTVNFSGKGKLVIPYLKEQGWEVLHSGYQFLFTRGRLISPGG